MVRKTPEEIAKEALRSGLEHLRLNAFGSWESDLTEGVAAAIREDRAEPVSEAEVEAACKAGARQYHDTVDRHLMRAALEAARQARATADEKGGAR